MKGSSTFDYRKTGHKKWKYALNQPYVVILTKAVDIPNFNHEWFSLTDNVLLVNKDYHWDGLTCFPDAKRWLMASLVHDVLTQGIHEKVIDKKFIQSSHDEMYDIVHKTANIVEASIIWAGLTALYPIWARIRKVD